jgi:hypothetical protein
MIGKVARLTVVLEDKGPVTLTLRPADLFAAEEALGFDPLAELTAASTVGAVSTRVLRGLVGLAWAAYSRTVADGPGLSFELFATQLESMPEVETEEDDAEAARPTPAAVSTG